MISFHRLDRFASQWLLLIGVSAATLAIGTTATAQRPKAPPTKKDGAGEPAAERTESKKRESRATAPRSDDDRFKPQAVDLDTNDGVIIASTYFPPVRPDKSTPAVILLHGHGEKQSVFWPSGTEKDLAFALQDKGYAVLTMDFRGHGHSTSRSGGAAAVSQKPGASGKLSLSELGTPRMPYVTLLEDIEAAKRYLIRRNNAGEINVGKLGVVGCEMGASLAVLWSFRDWQYKPQPGFAATKQGEDVQALVLVSPQYNFKGLSISKELTWLQPRVPMQVVVGKKDAKALAEAEKIVQSAKKALSAGTDSRLTDIEDVKIQGSRLLNPDHELDVEKEIVSFLDNTLKKKPAKWESRDASEDAKANSP